MREAARRRAALERAAADAAALGEVATVDPFDALERALGLAHARLAALARLDAPPTPAHLRAEGEAIDRLIRAARSAADVGLAERRARLAERSGALIVQALEEALSEADLAMDDEGKARLARRFGARLGALEASAGPPAAPG